MAGPNIGFATLSVIPSMRGAQAVMSKQLAGPATAVGATAGRSMGGSMVGTLGSVLKKGLVGGGLLLAAGVGLGKLGDSFDQSFDTIRVGTGATGEALEGLQGTFKSVFSAIPTDMASASTAVADLNTRLGLTGKELEIRSKQFLELSRITKSDLGTNIEAITRVFGDWGVETDQQTDSMNKIFRASQATGIGVDVLSRQLVQFGAPLRQLGFDFDTSAGLLGKFEKEGVNAELVMGSLRIALGKMARDGEPAQETLQRVTEEIANAGDTSKANALALELFGARAGPDMAAAIREGRFELGDLFDTIAFGQETIIGAAEDTNSWRESWTRLKNNVFVLLEPLATRVFNALGTGMDWVSEKAPVFAAWFSEHIWPAVTDVAGVLAELARDGLGAISSWWDNNGDNVASGIRSIGEFINDPVIPALTALFETARDDVLPALGDLYSFISDNEYILAGLAVFAGTILVIAFGAWAVAAGGAAIATLTAAAAAIFAYWPIFLLALGLGILAAGLWYAYQNWGWFRDGVNLAAAAIWSTILGISVLVGWLKQAWEWANNLVDALKEIKLPGGGLIGGVANAASGGFLGAFDDLPFGDHGGVWPGPKGVHSLGWVAGGETLLPTHRDDFEPLSYGDGSVVDELRALGDRIERMEVVLNAGRVAGGVRQADSYHNERNAR